IIDEILKYSQEYPEYAVRQTGKDTYGLDYPVGINMQAMLDVYNMSLTLKMDSLTQAIEPGLQKYYSLLYSTK
ncbi:MAG: hypothetical protein HPY62_09980, partial [Bacteroidales bacterium]|nr:hypothetical protein [Bacteroidales bacterium]